MWILKAIDKAFDYVGFIIIIGAVVFTYTVDYFFNLSKGMNSVDDEMIYVPILVIGFVLSALLCFGIGRCFMYVVKMFDKDYYNWYFGIKNSDC